MESPVDSVSKQTEDSLIIDEIKLLLEEKRIALQSIRNGIFILTALLLILVFMIGASRNYNMLETLHLIIPFYIIGVGMLGLAIYLIAHYFKRIKHFDRMIAHLMKQSPRVRDFIIM